jgi:glycine/D-amino acid oxidase-like deaminating enzyme
LPTVETTRRDWLRRAGLCGVGLALAECTPREQAVRNGAAPAQRIRLAAVRVARERVIRVVAGLRPYRRSGFVVRAERLGQKTVVHNYGHGGAGVTLSWGTAELAVELALATGERRAAVLGCGAVGLATARLLQRHGVAVTVYARDLPPQTTSNVAGAEWSPFAVVDHDRRTPEFTAQLERATRASHRAFQDLVGPRYGVRWTRAFILTAEPRAVTPSPLFPERRALPPAESPFVAPNAETFLTMLIEPPIYLQALLDDLHRDDGRVVVRTFGGRADVAALSEQLVVNCTGLGARTLWDDPELEPARGQLVVLPPQSEVDYLALAGDDLLYMFPRRDGIILGGTFERGVDSLEVDPAAVERILAGNARLLALRP